MTYSIQAVSFLPDRVFETSARGGGPARSIWDSLHIDRELGRGGIGVVYEVLTSSLNRAWPEGARGRRTESTDRLLDEARVVGQLEHPGVVPLFDGDVGPTIVSTTP